MGIKLDANDIEYIKKKSHVPAQHPKIIMLAKAQNFVLRKKKK